MCGIAAIAGAGWEQAQLERMLTAQRHRGPDDEGLYINIQQGIGLGHNRLSIIDLSAAGRQPMWSHDGAVGIVFNGEIYNYVELRKVLSDYPFHSRSDTEVILAAWQRWGEACLQRLIGMFAFVLWDGRSRQLFAVRDRLGVKPLYYAFHPGGSLLIASEIKALHRAGIPAAPDTTTWATYLATGLHDHSSRTFWENIQSVPPGHAVSWVNGRFSVTRWYDMAAASGSSFDSRTDDEVASEYLELLLESVRLRFRSDVPVGINLSGGLDSSLLLGLVHAIQGEDSAVTAFTFITGDTNYDETPWVQRMLTQTRHRSILCRLSPSDVPRLAYSVQSHEDEPFGGLPTLAYAQVFEQARSESVIVLLDGQGMDEQWAGYDYYASAINHGTASVVQGVKSSPVKPECLCPQFLRLAQYAEFPKPFTDGLRNLQYRDLCYTKIPRALRFNDRISMRSSTELREPFLDHRLIELALRQPRLRKLFQGKQKWLLRQIASRLLPSGVVEAPKRPVQTPQREWLRGSLRSWAEDCIETGLASWAGDWLDRSAVRATWRDYVEGSGDNSFFIWQWISIGLQAESFQSVKTATV